MVRWSTAAVLAVTALLLVRVEGQQPAPIDTFVDGELLVKFAPAVPIASRDAMLAGRGASRLRRFGVLNIDHVRLPRGLSMQAAIAMLQSLPGVEAVQPNYIRRPVQSAPPDDPFWLDGSLWGLQKIEVDKVWSTFTTGDAGVVVADIDTGVHYGHPDMAANMWRNPLEIPGNGIDDDGNGYVDDVCGIDTVNHDSDPADDHGHGTHTSGTIAAAGSNSLGVVGVNWQAKVLACKFIDASGLAPTRARSSASTTWSR